MAKQPLEIDMIAGSQLRDTQGEMLSVEGADISELEAGKGRFNDNHGKGFFNSIGRITGAKKIFKVEDCDDDRHTYYWNKVKAPFVYVKGYLYNDDEDHMNARAAAAILRNIHREDAPLKLKASVEGGILRRGEKDEKLLAATKIHSIALTFTPANNATLVEPISLSKSTPETGDERLIKSVMHLAKNWDEIPSFRAIERRASSDLIYDNLHKISELTRQLKGKELSINIPSSSEILQSALQAKIEKNVNKINALVKKMAGDEEEDLDKGIKSAIAGAALAGSMALSPVAAGEAQQPSPAKTQTARDVAGQSNKKASHSEIVNRLKTTNPALWSLAQVESSGGTNLKHDRLPAGMHKGHTAGGTWGIMPNTAKYVVGISKGLRNKYPDLAEKVKDVEKNHQYITNALNKNPDAAYDFAKTLYNHLDTVHEGDMNKVVHSWHHGIGGSNKLTRKNKDHSKSEYNQKFNKFFSKLKQKKVEKALTAGYGGAGAPTGRTSGAVFQTESLEGARVPESGFKYITCDHCGHEQVHMRHQVKCRKCEKTMSLEKLFRYMD